MQVWTTDIAHAMRKMRISLSDEPDPGLITGTEAAKLLGIPYYAFTAKVDLKELPAPVALTLETKKGKPYRVQRWVKSEILEKLPRDKEVEKKLPFPPATMAMLSILKSKSREGFVSGDETDFVCGNPPDERIWADIQPLIEKKKIKVGIDNWDRVTFTFVKGENNENDGNCDEHQRGRSLFEGLL